MRLNRLPIAIIEIVFGAIALVASIVNAVFWSSAAPLAPALFLGGGLLTVVILVLLIVFGFLSHKRWKKYSIEPHMYKRYNDILSVVLHVLALIFFLGGLLACFIGSTFFQILAKDPAWMLLCYYAAIGGCAGPGILAVIYHITRFFIEYHALSVYTKVEHLHETRKIREILEKK